MRCPRAFSLPNRKSWQVLPHLPFASICSEADRNRYQKGKKDSPASPHDQTDTH